MSRNVIPTALALPLALAIGVLIGVMSETGKSSAADECIERSQALASRYRLQRTPSANAELAVQRLVQMCRQDPAAFAHIMRADPL